MITLTTTLHDPTDGLAWLSDMHLAELQQLFDHIIIVATPLTSKNYIEKLKKSDSEIVVMKQDLIGKNYFAAIKKGYESDADYVFYCDFDRILHWIHFHPQELKQFVAGLRREEKKPSRIDYVICERTEQAYQSHHAALYWTEQLANMIISRVLREKKQHDHLSGCFVYSQKAARHIVRMGATEGQQLWGKWPLVLKKKKVKTIYKKFDGLEWETPDRYREEIKKLGGVKKFREQLSTEAEWKKRLAWVKEFIEDII